MRAARSALARVDVADTGAACTGDTGAAPARIHPAATTATNRRDMRAKRIGVLMGTHRGCHTYDANYTKQTPSARKNSGSRRGFLSGGGRIRTYDLWVMSPASYRAAPPRVNCLALFRALTAGAGRFRPTRRNFNTTCRTNTNPQLISGFATNWGSMTDLLPVGLLVIGSCLIQLRQRLPLGSVVPGLLGVGKLL